MTSDPLIRRLIGGDPALAAALEKSDNPEMLVAAALRLLDRAAAVAVTTRDRQLVAIAAAHLAGDADRVQVLARDHLADYPDNLLVAWIAHSSLKEQS